MEFIYQLNKIISHGYTNINMKLKKDTITHPFINKHLHHPEDFISNFWPEGFRFSPFINLQALIKVQLYKLSDML